ncbi:MAG: HAMP domain-containing protein [Bacteroidales bacterium]|nr:HAMP domain-containing protein [Bacteroidales bacterium]
MRIRSLSDKIVLYFVIIGITAIAVVSTYSFFTSKNALLNRTFDQLTSVRVVKKNQVKRFFQDRLGEMELITHTDGISTLEKSGETFNNNKQHQYLWEHLRLSGYYRAVFLQQKSGEIVTCNFSHKQLHFQSFDAPEKNPVSEILNGDVSMETRRIHDYVFDSLINLPRIFISGSMQTALNDKYLKAVLEISIDAINAIMLEQNPGDGLGQSGESYLVGADGLMRSTSRFQSNSIMRVKVGTDAVKNALENITGTSVIMDYRGINVLSSYSQVDIPGLNWVILAEIDYAEATRSIYFIRNNILLLTILVGIIVFIISYIFSKRITSPLIKLTDATANIKSGNLNVILPKINNDEIGQLTNSFNGMAQSLREKETELKEERNKRFTAMIDGQEIERQRLSRELHDGLGQSLIALKLRLESIDLKDACSSGKTLKNVKQSFDDTINEIRRISNDLMPAVLLEFGLITTLKNICESISENSGIDLRCSYSGKFNDLDNRTTIYLFRIIQEALNNIVKHAGASRAEVSLERADKLIKATISDNGIGLPQNERVKHTGNGIPNMRERVRLLHGKINIESENGKGIIIRIEIPVKETKHGNN